MLYVYAVVVVVLVHVAYWSIVHVAYWSIVRVAYWSIVLVHVALSCK